MPMWVRTISWYKQIEESVDPIQTTYTSVVIDPFRKPSIYTALFEGYKMFHIKANVILMISFEYSFTPASTLMNKENDIGHYQVLY